MKIAICDDDFRDIEYLRKNIQSHSDKHEIIEFLSAEGFLKRIYNGEHFDLLFLDVQMPDSDGWEIAHQLKKTQHKLFIAMVTVLGDHIYDCFDRVDWFAPKPVSKEKVWQILDSAEERLFPMVFEFQLDKLKVTLTAPEIIYFEVKRNSLFIHTTGGRYECRLPLIKAKDMLKDCPRFVQVHSSFIINLDHYCAVNGTCIILKNQEEIKLTRTYRNTFFMALSEYIRGV